MQFPEPNVNTMGYSGRQVPVAQIFYPHIFAVHNTYKSTREKLDDNLEFISLFRDAGACAIEYAIQVDAPRLLETGIEISESMMEKDAQRTRPLLIRILGHLQVFYQHHGLEGMRKAEKLTTRLLQLVEEELSLIPMEQWTEKEHIQLGRALLGKGVTLVQLGRMDMAEKYFDKALETYQLAGGASAIPNLFAMAYSRLLWISAINKDVEKTEYLNTELLNILDENCDADTYFRSILTFSAAMCLFTIGDLNESFRLHKDVYDRRLRMYGPNSPETLSSQYVLAIMYQHSGDLEQAELVMLSHYCTAKLAHKII
jgi:tetratricopeptide (TPR) repeat protein